MIIIHHPSSHGQRTARTRKKPGDTTKASFLYQQHTATKSASHDDAMHAHTHAVWYATVGTHRTGIYYTGTNAAQQQQQHFIITHTHSLHKCRRKKELLPIHIHPNPHTHTPSHPHPTTTTTTTTTTTRHACMHAHTFVPMSTLGVAPQRNHTHFNRT
jgi:hypothetical protein